MAGLRLTEGLTAVLALVGVRALDHIIIGAEGVYSMADDPKVEM